jgi:D-sedoheptulose 7-phosphate isomerase
MFTWIKAHFNTLHNLLLNTQTTNRQGMSLTLDEGFRQYIQFVKAIREHNNKIIFIGNGGSAGIASHLAIDYSKNGRLPAMAFNDASALTCLSNDYGYEHVFAKQVEFHARKGDVLIAISSSGKSVNILNAVEAARKIGCTVVTFSGFDAKNPLAKVGDINFYVDSLEYGFVEVGHMALGHAMLDHITGEMYKQAKSASQPTLATATV